MDVSCLALTRGSGLTDPSALPIFASECLMRYTIVFPASPKNAEVAHRMVDTTGEDISDPALFRVPVAVQVRVELYLNSARNPALIITEL